MRYLLRLLLVVLFAVPLLTVPKCSAQIVSPAVARPPATPQMQMVRLSYVNGDVKVSTGLNGAPDLDKNWVVAGVNFPMEEGTTLATEQGRAEVEFEDGSMIYLAEQSVLQFRRLSATAKGTSTKVTLLTGRATIDFEPSDHDEIYLKTADALLHLNTARVFRVDTALDGAVFRVVEGQFQFAEVPPMQPFSVGPGDAFQCVDGVLAPEPNLQDDADQKSWDQWVNDKRTARKADLATGLQAAGLATPIPGLVDLVRGGTFSDCAPYGRCWEPNLAEFPGDATSTARAPRSQNPGAPAASVPNANAARDCDATVNPGVRCVWESQDLGNFNYYEGPCGRGPMVERHSWVNKLVLYTWQVPKGKVLQTQWAMDDQPDVFSAAASGYPGWWRFPWATCRAGSWVPVSHPERFSCKPERGGKPGKCLPPKKWVVGPKRKSGSFVRVRVGKTDGFIPKHPSDQKGKPLLNADDGILTFHGNAAEEQEKVVAAPKTLQVLGTNSATYDANWRKALPKAERPVIQGRLFKASSELADREIRYDYKSKNFVANGKAAEGSVEKAHPVVVAHMTANKIYSGAAPRGGEARAGGGYAQGGTHSGNSSASSRSVTASRVNSESRGSTSSRSSNESRGNSQSYSASASENRAASQPSSSASASPRH